MMRIFFFHINPHLQNTVISPLLSLWDTGSATFFKRAGENSSIYFLKLHTSWMLSIVSDECMWLKYWLFLLLFPIDLKLLNYLLSVLVEQYIYLFILSYFFTWTILKLTSDWLVKINQLPLKCYIDKCQPTVHFLKLCKSSYDVNMDSVVGIPASSEVHGVIHFL